MRKPNWTVLYNIVSRGGYIGTGWEFFDDEKEANLCYSQNRAVNNVPCKRPFHEATDRPHMGVCHRN